MTNKRRAPNRQVAKRAEVQVECDLGGAVGTRRHTHRSDVGRAATCSSRSRVSGRWLEPDGPPRPRPWTRRRLRAIGRGRPVARLEHLHGGGDRNRTGVQGFAGSSRRILADTGVKNLLVTRARTSANTRESQRPRDGRGMEGVPREPRRRESGNLAGWSGIAL